MNYYIFVFVIRMEALHQEYNIRRQSLYDDGVLFFSGYGGGFYQGV